MKIVLGDPASEASCSMHGQLSLPDVLTQETIQFPPLHALNFNPGGNTIQWLIQPGFTREVQVENYSQGHIKGRVVTLQDGSDSILILRGSIQPPDEFNKVIRLTTKPSGLDRFGLADSSTGVWVKHPDLSEPPVTLDDYQICHENIFKSWENAFSYTPEVPAKKILGLRPPQIGAIHAVHAHWAVTDQVATVVMPTGTGKTETMLAVLVSQRCERLLVIVPTDPLRTQIADKFLTLGVLKQIGAVSQNALYPIIGVLRHKPKTVGDVDALFTKCQVIVTTMQIAGQCSDEIQAKMASLCPYLFIDEAHHIAAQTW
jgi:hypothetical protein